MSDVDWITSEQLGKARKIAKEYFDEFCEHSSLNTNFEQEWIEIEIDGQYFDLDCFDDNMDSPRTEVYCNIHATHFVPREGFDDWRETDGNKFLRLFTKTEDSDE